MYSELIKQLQTMSKASAALSVFFPQSEGSIMAKLLIDAADAIEELYLSGNNLVAVVDDMAEDLKKFRWIPVTERLPETDVDVLALYEHENTMCKKWTYICRASYIPKFTVLIEDKWNNCDGDWEDYNEDDDSFYVPEGWYEETSEGNGDGMSWFINATVTHWMPLPKPPEEKP